MLLDFTEWDCASNVSTGRSRRGAEIFIRAVGECQPKRQLRFQRNGFGISLRGK